MFAPTTEEEEAGAAVEAVVATATIVATDHMAVEAVEAAVGDVEQVEEGDAVVTVETKDRKGRSLIATTPQKNLNRLAQKAATKCLHYERNVTPCAMETTPTQTMPLVLVP
jgi:C4-type Zn-finger protein